MQRSTSSDIGSESLIHAFHGTVFHFQSFKPSPSGIHAGTYDQAAHAATLKLGRIPLKEFENLAVSQQGWRGVIYRVEILLGRCKRINDPRTPAKWRRAIVGAKQEGFDSIVYLNEFEGRAPADSYCIFDSERIRLVSVIEGCG